MLYRRFGRTGLHLSVFSCGGMRAMQSWSRGAPVSDASQANYEATVARALEVGINHIETARGYGTSECQLGRTLRKHPRDAYFLQTKIRPSDDPKTFEAQLEESFELLGAQAIDLVAIHGLNTAANLEQALRSGGCCDVLERFRRAGRVRAVGFSTHGPTPLILAAIGSKRFDYVNLHYYFIFQDNAEALAAARAQDMGVFIISPSDKGGRLYRPPAKLRELCRPLSPMVFNDLWCLSHETIHTLSLGAARPADFDEHLRVLPLLERWGELVPPIVARLEGALENAVGADYARRWRTGIPEWRELPGRINVKRILWLRNLVRAFDLLEFAQERYAAMSPEDNWVPGARAADFRDDEMRAALPESPFREQIPGLLREAHTLLHDPTIRPLP